MLIKSHLCPFVIIIIFFKLVLRAVFTATLYFLCSEFSLSLLSGASDDNDD